MALIARQGGHDMLCGRLASGIKRHAGVAAVVAGDALASHDALVRIMFEGRGVEIRKCRAVTEVTRQRRGHVLCCLVFPPGTGRGIGTVVTGDALASHDTLVQFM